MSNCWCFLLALALLAARSPAQPAMFTAGSLDAAREESIRTKRPLIVYLRGQGKSFDDMDATTWKSPTLRAWMLWHGIAVRVDMQEDRAQFDAVGRAVAAEAGVDPRGRPMILVFRDGRLDRTIPDTRFQGYLLGERDPILGRMNVGVGGVSPHPTTLQVLYGLDFYYDKLRAQAPVWHADHERMNPMPPPPPMPSPLFTVKDENAPAFPLAEGAAPDPMEVLGEARRLVADGAAYEATGHYTWLWERASADPAVRPIVMTAIADEVAALGATREGTRVRFQQLLDRALERQPWWTYNEIYEWMILQRITGNTQPVLDYFDLYLFDPQEATIVSAADQAAYRLLASPGGPIDTAATAELDSWVRRQIGRLSDAPPKRTTPEEWAKVQALRRRLILDNACRVYAARMADGDVPGADAVKSLVVQSLPESATAFDRLRTPRE